MHVELIGKQYAKQRFGYDVFSGYICPKLSIACLAKGVEDTKITTKLLPCIISCIGLVFEVLSPLIGIILVFWVFG